MNRQEKKIALNKQINDFTEELQEKASGFKDLGRDVLLIGGIIFAGYALMKIFQSDDDSETLPNEKKGDSIFFTAFKGAATSALLALAKVKLSEYLEQFNTHDE